MKRGWVDDEMSPDETLRRFETLDPKPATAARPGKHRFVEMGASRGDGTHDASGDAER